VDQRINGQILVAIQIADPNTCVCVCVRVCVRARVCVCVCRGACESSVPFVLFGTNTSRLNVEKSRRQLPHPSDVSLYDNGLPASHMVPSCLPVLCHSLTEWVLLLCAVTD